MYDAISHEPPPSHMAHSSMVMSNAIGFCVNAVARLVVCRASLECIELHSWCLSELFRERYSLADYPRSSDNRWNSLVVHYLSTTKLKLTLPRLFEHEDNHLEWCWYLFLRPGICAEEFFHRRSVWLNFARIDKLERDEDLPQALPEEEATHHEQEVAEIHVKEESTEQNIRRASAKGWFPLWHWDE